MKTPEPKLAPRNESLTKRAEIFARKLGLNWDNLSSHFKEMFTKMNAWGHLEASENMNRLAEEVLRDPNITPLYENNPDALGEVLQGITLSDIGKRGPKESTRVQSDFFIAIYKIKDKIENPENTTLLDFLSRYLENFKTQKERTEILESLRGYGISPEMNIRDFFKLHTGWSLEILEAEPSIKKEVREIVARHHTLEGVNLIEGELSLKDKVVILLDKYDAYRHREPRTHQETIDWLRNKLNEMGWHEDIEFTKLLEALDKKATSVRGYEDIEAKLEEVAA